MRALLMVNDSKTANFISRGLNEQGFVVDVASSGEIGEERALKHEYDVIVLDWLLQYKDGLAVCRALRLLDESDSNLGLTLLARRCGVSSAYLSRVFGRQMGVSLNQYRNSMRLSRFWEHYRSPGQKTITESVYAAGFGSYAQFHKIFSQAHGRGPREHLQSLQEVLM